MAELAEIEPPTRRGALATAQAAPLSDRIAIVERAGLALLQVAALPGGDAALGNRLAEALGLETAAANRATGADGLGLHAAGPGRWLVVAAEPIEALSARVASRIGGNDAALVDLSQARSVVRLTGPAWRDLLAKGVRIDLHPKTLPPGSSVQTMFGRIAVTLHVLPSGEGADLLVYRGFALTLWEMLTDGMREFAAT
ncbi:MAG TPA: sarcosine oxidase subunit gamma family protein [Stellaceae bacterium]|nr:sarcosine oxidase subunit gamma family protein [Stellaceae bacterium]